MREVVGTCIRCGKTVYCADGFLDGVYDEKDLYCHPCWEEMNNEDS